MGCVQSAYMREFKTQNGAPGIPGMVCVCHGIKIEKGREECILVLDGW